MHLPDLVGGPRISVRSGSGRFERAGWRGRLAALSGVILLGSVGSQAAVYTTYSVEVQDVQQQTGIGTLTGGFSGVGYNRWALVAKIDTLGAALSAAPWLGLPAPTTDYPGGTITFPTGAGFSPTWAAAAGYNRYQYGNAWSTVAELTAGVGSGNFTFHLGDATATPTLSLNTASPVMPPTPLLTGGGTWSGSSLLVDATVANTFFFNSGDFTTYSSGLAGLISINLFTAGGYPTPYIGQVSSQYGLGKSDSALTSLTLASDTLVTGQTYYMQVNYTQLLDTNGTPFTGTGITGNPLGLAYDTTTTFITIQAIPEPATTALLTGLVMAGALLLVRRRRGC